MQLVLVVIAIVLALSYIGYKFYKQFIAKDSPCEGCAISKTSQKTD